MHINSANVCCQRVLAQELRAVYVLVFFFSSIQVRTKLLSGWPLSPWEGTNEERHGVLLESLAPGEISR